MYAMQTSAISYVSYSALGPSVLAVGIHIGNHIRNANNTRTRRMVMLRADVRLVLVSVGSSPPDNNYGSDGDTTDMMPGSDCSVTAVAYPIVPHDIRVWVCTPRTTPPLLMFRRFSSGPFGISFCAGGSVCITRHAVHINLDLSETSIALNTLSGVSPVYCRVAY